MPRSHRITIAAALLSMALSAPLAVAHGTGGGCDVSGTWQNAGYLLTVTPIAAGRYQIRFSFGYDPTADGIYLKVTDYVGEMSKARGQTYEAHSISYWAWNPKSPDVRPGVDLKYSEIDAVRARVYLEDCNTLMNLIDTLWVYFPTDENPNPKPFVAPPDIDLLQGATYPERYYRMPTACPLCPPLAKPLPK
jgi:hypothetical protein